MRGLVFTALLQTVEDRHGLPMLDQLLSNPELSSGGVFTAVGNYDHQDLMVLLSDLAQRTGRPVHELVVELGKNLFPLLIQAAPSEVVDRYRTTFDFLEIVHDVIHVHVRKLDPDAELPTFSTERDGDERMEMTYTSSRPFADLAEGLILGCVAHFGELLELSRESIDGESSHRARFILVRG
jgi:hypothetical protein